jgi:NAD+ kinase
MHIAIYNRVFEEDDLVLFKQLFVIFEQQKIAAIIYEDLIDRLKGKLNLPEQFETFSEQNPLPPKTRFLLSLGGDGTMLDTVQFVGDKNIPILGINLGRLGFLASTTSEQIEFAISSLMSGNYLLDPRTLLHLDSSIPQW